MIDDIDAKKEAEDIRKAIFDGLERFKSNLPVGGLKSRSSRACTAISRPTRRSLLYFILEETVRSGRSVLFNKTC